MRQHGETGTMFVRRPRQSRQVPHRVDQSCSCKSRKVLAISDTGADHGVSGENSREILDIATAPRATLQGFDAVLARKKGLRIVDVLIKVTVERIGGNIVSKYQCIVRLNQMGLNESEQDSLWSEYQIPDAGFAKHHKKDH